MREVKGEADGQMTRTWRPAVWERIGAVIVSAAFLVFAVALVASGTVGEGGEYVGLCAFFVVSGSLFGLYAIATSLATTHDLLIVRNLGRRRNVRLDQIRSIRSGYYGTEIRCNNGRWFFALAVQKPRISEWLGRRTRSDEVEKLVMDAVRRSHNGCE